MNVRRTLFTAACALASLGAGAQAVSVAAEATTAGGSATSCCSAAPAPQRITSARWLWGMGRASVLDTYLSPLTYSGPNLTVEHLTERTARWGHGRITTVSRYTLQAASIKAQHGDGREWDAELSAAGGWRYNLRPARGLRIGLGGVAELTTGFTYNSRGSNNPAQGRLGLSLGPSVLTEYAFSLWGRPASASLELEGQALGLQFAPEYGQSYYEIFSLGHSDGTVHFTHPANCPTARLQALVTLPVWGARLTLGYLGDVRQSSLGGLKRHAWRNGFLIGYTRQLVILRPHRSR